MWPAYLLPGRALSRSRLYMARAVSGAAGALPRPDIRRGRAEAVAAALLLLSSYDGARAQRARSLELPVSDLNAPRTAVALLRSNLLDPLNRGRFSWAFQDSASMAADPQASVGIGTTVQAFSLSLGGCELASGIEGAVFARFRLATHSKDQLSNDWWVAWPSALTCGPMRLRARYRHRSAHLGDDILASVETGTYDWTHEYAEGLLTLEPIPGLRIFGGGGKAVRSRIPGDCWEATTGAELAWEIPGAGGVGAIAGGEVDWATRSESRTRRSFAAGLDLPLPQAMPLRILLRRFSGGAAAGQFDGNLERGWGLELGLRP